MFKRTDLVKTIGNETYERMSSEIVDHSRLRERDGARGNLENCSNERFNEIKRKYGMKDKLVGEPAEGRYLREMNLNSSNSYILKDKQQNYKSRSASVCKSTFFNQKIEGIAREGFRESIVKKIDEEKDIPRFGGQTNWEGIFSKSIEVPRDERLGAIDKLNIKIHQALNLDIKNPKQEQNSFRNNDDIVTSKIYTQTENNSTKLFQERQSRRVESIDDKMKRLQPNFTVFKQNKRSKTPHLQSKGEDSFRHRNFDDEIKRIEERIKKSNEQKKRLDIVLPQRQNIQLPKRVLDYERQKPLAFIERRHRISGYLPQMKLKTQECERGVDMCGSKQSNRFNVDSKFDFRNQKYNDWKCQDYEKQISTRRSFDEKTELNKLVEALRTQVQLDEKLRNAKVSSSSTHAQNKWSLIKQSLEKQKIFFSEPKVQSEFQISQQQHNPFFSIRQSSKSFDQVIRSYSQSYKHWTANIFQKFSLTNLTKAGFCQHNIDLTKKGQISIEDLVRFLNFQTKNFYRNRDLFLIWKRITTKNSLQFEELTNNICHK